MKKMSWDLSQSGRRDKNCHPYLLSVINDVIYESDSGALSHAKRAAEHHGWEKIVTYESEIFW